MSDIVTQLGVKITNNTNTAFVTAADALKVDGSAVTQPVSGTVTADAGAGTFTTSDTATRVDDAAFTVATDRVMAIGALADETTPDSVNEGDIGIPRMTLTRLLKTKLIGDSGGTDVPISVDGSGNVQVDVVSGGGGAIVDGDAFTVDTSAIISIGGVFDDTLAVATSGDSVGLRSTGYRALHTNLRDNSGVEVGTAGAPLRTDPTGTTTQPVSGTVTANAGTGTFNVAGTGTAGSPGTAVLTVQGISGGTPLPVEATFGEVTTDVISYYDTVSSVANAATGTITYTVSVGKTFMLKQIIASSSGAPCKVTVDYGGGPTTVFVGFYASSSPFLSVDFAQPIPIAASTAVNVKIQNNAGSSQDVYGFIGGVEI